MKQQQWNVCADNIKCKEAPGCGEWQAPSIPNPKYRGKWKPPMIDNPNYKVSLSVADSLVHLVFKGKNGTNPFNIYAC